MRRADKKLIGLVLVVGLPIASWIGSVKFSGYMDGAGWRSGLWLIENTYRFPVLYGPMIFGLVVAIGLIFLMLKLTDNEFSGANFGKFYRGRRVVGSSSLRRKTHKRGKKQINVGGIPMPFEVENLHLLVNGATGGGKSVLLRSLAASGLRRNDKFIFIDPNGDMLSKFFREGDVLLNPYDARTQNWSFINEIRHDYDYERLAFSIISPSASAETEVWNGYARLLLRETAKKLKEDGDFSIEKLAEWTGVVDPALLQKFLAGTAAQTLFVGGADRALGSARFTLADKLAQHIKMPAGNFSLRGWLENPEPSDLYIPWREDMRLALRPLISCWVDILCASILSMPEDENRRIWLVIDELASLEKLASLESALTKGRKNGLRIVAGLQSVSQLDTLYGTHEAQTIRACFRNLVVLGGSTTDPKICEEMSKSIGEHEVERDKTSRTSGMRRGSTNEAKERSKERIVLPTEIASLPPLTGYVSFAGDYPIARVKLEPESFPNNVMSFMENTAAAA